jgi:hypothetical protein
MGSSFWNDFFANFLSDLLVGAVLGALIALWVGRRLSAFERSQQRREERGAELNKAIRYLELLQDEVNLLLSSLLRWIGEFQRTGWGIEFKLTTPVWDILQPSGELPKLLDPRLIASLARFYDHLAFAKREKDLVIDTWLVSQPSSVPGMGEKKQAFVNF